MPFRELKLSFRTVAAVMIACIAIAVALRVFAPSDLDSRDQSRTIAYTVDMVYNGNLILAADTAGLPATKPPLVNYLQAPFVYAFGPQEWAFRLPSLFAFAGILWLVYLAARFTFAASPAQPSLFFLTQAEWAVLLSVAFYAISNVPLRHSFLARPDTVLTFGMTLAWYAAMRAQTAREMPHAAWAAWFWLGTMIAALAKGPLALVPILYAVLAAKLLHDDWGRIRNLRPAIGLPATLAVGLAWPAAVVLIDPGHFVNILLDDELGNQFKQHWYSQIVMIVLVPLYLISRFLPWSVAGIAGAFVFPWRQWRSHALAPAMLYLGLLMISLMITTSIRGDRLASFIPPLAVICAWGAVYQIRNDALLRISVASVPIAVIGFGVYYHFISHHAENRWGENILDFAERAKAHTGGEPVLFCPMDHLIIPVEPLFGINQRGAFPKTAPPEGAWVVTYHSDRWQPAVRSGPIHSYVLDLYRAAPNSEVCR